MREGKQGESARLHTERARGCLLGQLSGDALGSLVEFQTPTDIRRPYPCTAPLSTGQDESPQVGHFLHSSPHRLGEG